MGNIAGILGLLSLLVGALAFVGAVVRGKAKDVNIATLESGNAELRAQVLDKDTQIADYKIRLTAASTAAATAEEARKLASDLAQSRPAFENLGEQMLRQHKQLLGAIGKQTKELTKLASVITKGRA
jgi:hypothetical protein